MGGLEASTTDLNEKLLDLHARVAAIPPTLPSRFSQDRMQCMTLLHNAGAQWKSPANHSELTDPKKTPHILAMEAALCMWICTADDSLLSWCLKLEGDPTLVHTRQRAAELALKAKECGLELVTDMLGGLVAEGGTDF